ncbi:auxin-responsive protein SAUR36-like [Humulus lupulus]|uniref:auxin-responsive protein SAUR36-like n=1 Tax=Humulus lupulus TaxID=3486 RepID=UPI002B4154BD|nr:auxin-responsive protein SAUR36-like [Humulus lupulus]
MRKAKGFKLKGKPIVKIYKWVISRRKIRTRGRTSTSTSSSSSSNPMAKVLTLARSFRRGAKQLCSPKSGYVPLSHDPVESPKQQQVQGIPKGHLAVYVGESQDETQRYLVPVIYFNHPLFGDLLKEAEKVHGFNHPGRITIPCGASEFEKVQMRIIASGGGGEHCRRRRFRRSISRWLSK